MSDKFYPRLSNIIHLNGLPEQLNFIEGGLQQFANGLFYRNYQVNRSADNITTSVNIELVTFKELKISIPGTGIVLSFNSDYQSGGHSYIPINLSYSLGINKYIPNFNLSNFSFSPEDIFDILFRIANISNEEAIISMTCKLAETSSTPLDDIASQLITDQGLVITLPLSTNFDTALSDLTSAIENQDVNIMTTLLTNNLLTTDIEDTTNNIKDFYYAFVGKDPVELLKELFVPKIKASININAGLKFPRKYLIPLDSSFEPLPIVDVNNPPLTTLEIGNVDFYFDTAGKIGFDEDMSINLTPTYSEIGNTGVIITFSNVKLDLSKKTNIAEANVDGRPADFMGVYVDEAEVFLPKKWFSDPDAGELPPGVTTLPVGVSIKGTNLLIGTGGISGTIGLEGNNNLYKKIGNFWIGLDSFSLTFKQNAITESDVTGKLIIPKFKDKTTGGNLVIDVKAHIGQDGEFNLTASNQAGIPVFELEDVFALEVNSLFIGRQTDVDGGKAYIGVSGKINFGRDKKDGETDADFDDDNFSQFLPKDLEVKKMLIYDDGSYEFEGGGFVLPKSFEFELGPAKIAVTAIHMGSYETNDRKYKFFGFDGGVNVNPGGVDARGKGVKLFYTIDDGTFDWFIRLESLNINIVLPSGSNPDDAAVIIKGFLSIKDPVLPTLSNPPTADELKLNDILKNSTEYAGSVYVSLPSSFKGFEISAAMRLNPSVPSFIVDLGIELPSPILLGTTGLGIYGFRGLFGQKYVATKESAGVPEDGEWWQYYKAKIEPDYKEGIQVSKFSVKNGFSIGAGVSLATTADSGKTLSTKLFFMLSLPDVFLFQGQAAILKERISLDGVPDPPFFAMIAISNQSIEAGFGASYKLPGEGSHIGEIITVDGIVEMGFFFGNSSAWYINVGRDNPDNMRIHARVVNMFNMYSYLMLSNSGIKIGAGTSYSLSKEFGPLKADLSAYLDLSGKIAFRPSQIGGAFHIGGNVEMSVCGFGFSVSAGATLAAEAPKPFIIAGDMYACVKVMGKEYCAKFEFTWNIDNNLDESQVPLLAEVDSDNNIIREDAQRAACATNITTGETFPVSVLSLPVGSTIPAPTAESVTDWIGDISNEKYTIPMDSFIDIEFKKPMLSNSSNTSGNLHHLGGVASPSIFSDLIPPQKGKSPQVKHTYSLDKIEINYFDELAETWKPYSFYNAMLPMFETGEVASLVEEALLKDMKWGYWQQQKIGYNNKLRLLATTPLSYASKTGDNITIENLGINADSIFCNGEKLSLTCVEFDDNNTVFEENELHNYKDIILKPINYDGIIIDKPFEEYKCGLYIEPEKTLEIIFPESMYEINLVINSEAEEIKIKYFRKIHIDPESKHHLPTFDFELLDEFTFDNDKINDIVKEGGLIKYNNKGIDYITIESGIVKEPKLRCIPLNVQEGTLNELSVFISQLITNKHLTSERDIILNSEENIRFYNPSYINTALYPNTLGEKEDLILSRKYISEKSLVISISDSQGFVCKFVFEFDEKSIDYSSITSVDKIIPIANCEHSDTSNSFILVVSTKDESGISIIVKSCITIGDCYCYTENSTSLYQICYSSMQDYNQVNSQTTDAQQTLNNSMLLKSISNTLQPIWRPNTAYSIRLKTSDKLEKFDGDHLITYQNDIVIGFRTAGPIGHFHKFPKSLSAEAYRAKYAQLKTKAREEEYKLNSLKHYIDYAKSYPNADGDLMNAKPLFYSNAELNMVYLHNYVYEFFNNWVDYDHIVDDEPAPIIANSKLKILIKDPTEIVTTDDPSTTSFKGNKISHKNGATNNPALPPDNISNQYQDVIMLNNMLANSSSPCVTSYSQLTPIDISSSKIVNLKPSKLYTAQFISNYNPRINNDFKSEAWSSVVHSYVFQTSRYASFSEQIESYILSKDVDGNINKTAVFSLEANPTGTSATLLGLAKRVLINALATSEESLIVHYADPFDRLINGVLNISLPEAVTTEFNVIKNPLTGVIIGIIVQNPEPFNDPKLPISDANASSTEEYETLEVQKYSGSNWGLANEFFVIHSKDRSKMFITKRDFSFAISSNEKLKFKFKYKLYDGINYSDKSTEVVEIDLSNYIF